MAQSPDLYHINRFGSFHKHLYDTLSHENLCEALENFETIYQGNSPDFDIEVKPEKCTICNYKDGCPFKTQL